MAKLSNSEIKAIVNKINREAYTKVYQIKENLIENFDESSLEYQEQKVLIEKMHDLYEEAYNIQKYLSKKYNHYIISHSTIESNLRFLKEGMVKKLIPEIPSESELETDLIIAAIDSDFDVKDFINNYLKQYDSTGTCETNAGEVS